jgi:iron complex transport system permease protein
MDLKQNMFWILLSLLLLVLFISNLSFGSVNIPPGEIISILAGRQTSNSVWAEIIWNFRMTRALTCILAGSALSLGGLQMQTLFRNPLAGPDVLGLSSGASLAVALIFLGNFTGLAFFLKTPWAIAIAASVGSACVFLVMLLFSRKLQDNVSLLIIGLMIGAGVSSVVSVLQFFSKAEELQTYVLWTFGSLGSLNWQEINVLALILAAGVFTSVFNIKSLNAWLLGEQYARSLGIDIKRARIFAILSASIVTGGVTAFCGPIAFVGLAVPHLIKMMLPTTNHKFLIPGVLMGGACLLLFCDLLSQLPGSTHVLPINAITAIIGSPVVILVILKNKIMRV